MAPNKSLSNGAVQNQMVDSASQWYAEMLGTPFDSETALRGLGKLVHMVRRCSANPAPLSILVTVRLAMVKYGARIDS